MIRRPVVRCAVLVAVALLVSGCASSSTDAIMSEASKTDAYAEGNLVSLTTHDTPLQRLLWIVASTHEIAIDTSRVVGNEPTLKSGRLESVPAIIAVDALCLSANHLLVRTGHGWRVDPLPQPLSEADLRSIGDTIPTRTRPLTTRALSLAVAAAICLDPESKANAVAVEGLKADVRRRGR